MKKILSFVFVLVSASLFSPAYASEKIDDGDSIDGSMCIDLKKACELGDCRGINAARKAGQCK